MACILLSSRAYEDVPSPLASKTCIQCGRPFSWRKKWALSWAEVRYCSKGCRKKGPQDPARIQAFRALLQAAPRRTLALDSALEAKLSCEREALRACARLLEQAGQASFILKGRRVSAEAAKGKLALRLL
ncbi:MAG: hypothetical protein ACI9VR_002391 [Cognaticolwellia sp.]|jgi:hypothetical protein